MTTLLTVGGLLVFIATLPAWLPSLVLALRMRIFARINGEEGIAIPGALIGASHLKQVYAHPAADGRSRGAALSDLFWYWLSPGPEMHQEHLEPGEEYEEVARATRRILAMSRQAAEELAANSAARVLIDEEFRGLKLVRLRDLMMPIWADFYYELVFGERCPPHARQLIVGNANDVVTALKCCSLRHMERRHRLTRLLVAKLEADEVKHLLPERLSIQQRALYLQGVFFNTAVVQMSEAMAHLIMVLAHHRDVQAKLVADLQDERYFDRVITETLRVYPLFGISHRITSADIAVDDQRAIPKGSVLCFNHPEYQRLGFHDAERFDPDRWKTLSVREANYIPFGVSGNRPCPAQTLAIITMRAAASLLLRRFDFFSSASHTRSLPNRGPCLFVRRGRSINPWLSGAILLFLRWRDRLEDVWRSIVQLVLGTYMVWDARRLRLCERHFETHPPDAGRPSVNQPNDRGAGAPGLGNAQPNAQQPSAGVQTGVCPIR